MIRSFESYPPYCSPQSEPERVGCYFGRHLVVKARVKNGMSHADTVLPSILQLSAASLLWLDEGSIGEGESISCVESRIVWFYCLCYDFQIQQSQYKVPHQPYRLKCLLVVAMWLHLSTAQAQPVLLPPLLVWYLLVIPRSYFSFRLKQQSSYLQNQTPSCCLHSSVVARHLSVMRLEHNSIFRCINYVHNNSLTKSVLLIRVRIITKSW